MKEERFIKVYGKGVATVSEIWVDRETGVNYFYHSAGYGAGLTPLLNADGTPVVTPVDPEE